MADSVERLLVRIDATTESLRRELKAAEVAVNSSQTAMEKAQSRMSMGWDKANAAVEAHRGLILGIGAAAVGGVALAVKSIANYSDSYQRLQGQLKLVTNSQDELNRVYSATKSLAAETGASLDATVNLYARMTRATEELNLTEQDRLRLTETINKSMVVSGASTQEAEAAIRQLSQGMASGVLRGEELNSVMENSPRLARALADGLGVGIGQLREMGKAGELTGEAVTNALLQMGEEIDAEFTKMPVTVDRAMNRISIVMQDAIGKADMSPVTESINQLEEALNDPAVINGITQIASGLVSLTSAAAKAASGIGALIWATKELTGFGTENLIDIIDQIDRLNAQLKYLEEGGAGNSQRADKLREELAGLTKQYDEMVASINKTAAAREGDSQATEENAGAQQDLSAIIVTAKKKESAALSSYQKVQDKAAVTAKKLADVEARRTEKVRDTITALDRQLTAIQMNERAQVIYNATMDAAEYAHGEELAAIVDKTVALYDQQQAIEATGEETKRAADAAEEAAERSAQAAADAMQPWNDALQDMAANIDQGFSQAWVDAFSGAEDGFKNFAKNMKDAFFNLLGNMAHMAFTRPIVMQISAAMGGLVPGAAMAGAGGMPSVLGGGFNPASMLSGLTSATAGLYSTLGTITNDFGLFKVSNAFNAKALSTTGWSMAGDVLGGIGGAYAGNQLYGSTSGIGNAVGGIAGSALIPVPVLGAAIGSFVGGAIEKGLGNVFGYGGNNNDGKNVARADFDFATGTFGQGTGSGNSWKKGEGREQATYLDQIMEQLVAFGDAIGGSSLKGRITADSGGNLTFNGKAFSDASELLSYGFTQIIAESDNVSDNLKELIRDFQGTAEETASYAASMVSYFTGATELDDALKDLLIAFNGTAAETIAYTGAMIAMSEAVKTNPVDLALKDMVTALENADLGISGAYYKQLEAVKTLIAEYDGTASAAVELNDAFMLSRASAYQLAQTILEMSDAIGTMLGDQAQYFREAVMTEDELRKAREAQRSSLVDQLRTASDPQQVMELVNEFATVNKQLFDSLNEEQRLAQVDSFTAMTTEVDAIAQSILGTSLNDLKLSQDEINAQMIAAVTGAAGSMQKAADDMSGHVTTFGEYVSMLVSRGIRIDITGGGGGEVTA